MKREQKENLKKILFVVGLVLVCSFIYSIFNVMSSVKGYETADATCVYEDKYYSDQTAMYKRKYLYYVSGKEYELNNISVEKKPCEVIKYNPNNPEEARAYSGVTNIDGIVLFFIGLLFMFGPNLLKIDGLKIKLDELKNKSLRISKPNTLQIVRIYFLCFIMFSVLLSVGAIFSENNWNEILGQYTSAEIIMECIFFIVQRCSIEKCADYCNIFRN